MMQNGRINSPELRPHLSSSGSRYRKTCATKKRHFRDILGRTEKKLCHTYDTSMTIIMKNPGIIIDVVGSYFYDTKS